MDALKKKQRDRAEFSETRLIPVWVLPHKRIDLDMAEQEPNHPFRIGCSAMAIAQCRLVPRKAGQPWPRPAPAQPGAKPSSGHEQKEENTSRNTKHRQQKRAEHKAGGTTRCDKHAEKIADHSECKKISKLQAGSKV